MPGVFVIRIQAMRKSLKRSVVFIPIVLAAATAHAQSAQKFSGAGTSSTIKHDLALAEHGHCAEALPALRRNIRKLETRDLRRQAGVDGVHCAMTLNRPGDAAEFLSVLSGDFPEDPEVLYLLVHAYSDLSTQAAEQLARSAPTSTEAHELNAEAFEQQGKWDQAEAEYRAIVRQNPQAPGIHFRLGRLLLSRPNPSAYVAEQAKRECLRELQIDPSNAGAEYVLGELARQDQQWEEAIRHFARAGKLDPGFGDAFLGWGEALISTRKFTEAIPPLELAVRLESANPATHYNLATAYSRSGRKAEADKEFAIHRQMTQKSDAGQDSSSETNPVQNPN